MVTVVSARNQFQKALDANSDRIRFRYFTSARNATDYDDVSTLSKSGTDIWTSGNIQPLSNSDTSSVSLLGQQGKILTADLKLYIQGTTDISGLWKVGIGSPIRDEYAMIQNGANTQYIGGSAIFHKVFIRTLNTGSLVGE